MFAREERVEDRAAIPLWPDMRVPFALFCDAPWQWVAVGLGGTIRVGILRSELEASARLLDVEITPAIFADIRVMEEAALDHWARKR